jgi:catechol 2,3-dioxygenase-like lactoylglutathione lyase family enzyme
MPVSVAATHDDIIAPALTRPVDLKLEVVVIPVSDVDRAKRFYADLGWRLDADFVNGSAFRVVQFTPPGSETSVHFGKGITSATPGAGPLLYLVVSDIEAARRDLVARGAEVSAVFHRLAIGGPTAEGIDPARRSYNSFATFEDPDKNQWLLQEVTARLPGRVAQNSTVFASPGDLASALRRAAAAHGEHERRTGKHDPDWPELYAEHIAQEQAGGVLPL